MEGKKGIMIDHNNNGGDQTEDEECDSPENMNSSNNKEKKKRGTSSAGMMRSSRGAFCQAERCGADLSEAKRYHRRHKVCEPHSKAPVVHVAGLRQRFCQQCSRFHEISEFDEAKRSCRRRLAGHNERRRKSSVECYSDTSAPKNNINSSSSSSKETHYNEEQRAKFHITLQGNSQFNKHYQIRS